MPNAVIRRLPSGPGVRSGVCAAGGILLRADDTGRTEVALIHRPGHDDWTMPKGKLEPGESFEDCALREVLEETGYACSLSAFVGTTEYVDRRGRPKTVGYWLMDPAEGVSFQDATSVATDEVDELRWMALPEARRALSYRRDQELLDSVASAAHPLSAGSR